MERPDVLELGSGRRALAICPEHETDLPAAIRLLGVETPQPTLVAIGGASGIDEAGLAALVPVAEALVRAARATGATIVDGGTDAGFMGLVGRARAAARSDAPLVGVLPQTLACRPGEPRVGSAATLEPNHTHFVLVPGSTWGDEAPWLAHVADVVAGSCPSVTVLVNGGDVSLTDVAESLDGGRRVLAVAGTGRAADALVAALGGSPADARMEAFTGTGLVEAVSVGEDAWPPLEERVEAILGSRSLADGD